MLNRDQIQEIIPHRYPFLLVDRILEMDPGKSAIGEKDINFDEFFFPGHFPNEPIMPGVLIIEALAQTGAVTLLSAPEHQGKKVYFAGIKHAKFRRKVVPGDILRMEVQVSNLKSRYGMGISKAYVGNELACEAEFSFIFY